MYTDIFIVRRNGVFRNFRIFPFVEKAIFSLFSSRKDAHFFDFVTQKRYGNVTFSDYGNVRKSPKILLCEKIGFCAVLYQQFQNKLTVIWVELLGVRFLRV